MTELSTHFYDARRTGKERVGVIWPTTGAPSFEERVRLVEDFLLKRAANGYSTDAMDASCR